jgi:2-dehydro-3-deoxyphosphogluconate aldolase / (4S)-4-hydroxy-2-oxoglutarate aldolase
MSQLLLERLKAARVVGVIRLDRAEDALWTGEKLIEAGVSAIEITFTVPDATGVITALRNRFPDILVGAGTVLSCQQAEMAVSAGAGFLVSPVMNADITAWSKQVDTGFFPGCATPSEVFQAIQLGATGVKLFPVDSIGGVSFLKAIRDVFPELSIMPTGGINSRNAAMVTKRQAKAFVAHVQQFLGLAGVSKN